MRDGPSAWWPVLSSYAASNLPRTSWYLACSSRACWGAPRRLWTRASILTACRAACSSSCAHQNPSSVDGLVQSSELIRRIACIPRRSTRGSSCALNPNKAPAVAKRLVVELEAWAPSGDPRESRSERKRKHEPYWRACRTIASVRSFVDGMRLAKGTASCIRPMRVSRSSASSALCCSDKVENSPARGRAHPPGPPGPTSVPSGRSAAVSPRTTLNSRKLSAIASNPDGPPFTGSALCSATPLA